MGASIGAGRDGGKSMSHTLHRIGTRDSLAGDYVLLAKAAVGYTDKGAEPKLKRVAQICQKHNPVNIGRSRMLTDNLEYYHMQAAERRSRDNLNIITDNIPNSVPVHAVFASREDLLSCLREIKAEDLGLCVVVSGLLEEVDGLLKELDSAPHTVEHSGGIWGKKELLCDGLHLEATTMCGHGMVAARFLDKLVEDVKSGGKTPEAAAEELAKPCGCGIVNPARAAAIIRKLAFGK